MHFTFSQPQVPKRRLKLLNPPVLSASPVKKRIQFDVFHWSDITFGGRQDTGEKYTRIFCLHDHSRAANVHRGKFKGNSEACYYQFSLSIVLFTHFFLGVEFQFYVLPLFSRCFSIVCCHSFSFQSSVFVLSFRFIRREPQLQMDTVKTLTSIN